MHAIFCLSRTIRSNRRPASSRLGRRSPVRFAPFLTAGLAIAVLATAGCESVEKLDVTQPLPERLSPEQLFLVTKADWQNCLADFYRDDWNRLNEHVGRMSELAARWKGVVVPPERKKDFDSAVIEFDNAVASFKVAVQAKDVDRTTEAMRRLGKRIAIFESMK